MELAQRYCQGYPPQVLLDELVRTACVQDLGNGFYRALTRSYVPEQLSAESIRRFAQVVHNVIETLEVNLRRSDSGLRRVERTVFADYGLPREALGAFDKYIRDRGQIFADDIDNWLSARSHEGQQDGANRDRLLSLRSERRRRTGFWEDVKELKGSRMRNRKSFTARACAGFAASIFSFAWISVSAAELARSQSSGGLSSSRGKQSIGARPSGLSRCVKRPRPSIGSMDTAFSKPGVSR